MRVILIQFYAYNILLIFTRTKIRIQNLSFVICAKCTPTHI